METLQIAATSNTPEVLVDFEKKYIKLAGESHPEDVTDFYQPVIQAVDTLLEGLGTAECCFDFEFIYFNSSSAKIVMMLMDRLDETAKLGSKISIRWYFDVEDDTMRDLGEEFGEDLEHASFELLEMNN